MPAGRRRSAARRSTTPSRRNRRKRETRSFAAGGPSVIRFSNCKAMFANPPCDEGVVRAASALTPGAAALRSAVLAATILASSMAFIDGTVVNVALPALQREFGATISEAQWVVESYALFLSALLLVGGASGDRFGRRRVFAIGTVLFAAASVCCGLSGSMNQLIVARALQGVGAALLVPGSLAIISATFDERTRGAAFGTWSAATASTTALGPVLGGWLIDHLSWRAVFFINVPLAVAVLCLTFRRVPETTGANARGSLDWPGAALAALGLAGLVYALIEGPATGWRSERISGSFGIGVVALAVFIAVEARRRTPMVPLDLFGSREFSGSNLLTFLLYAALGGGLFFLPLDLIQVQRYSATAAGAALLPFILLVFTLSRWSGGLVDRYGARLPLIVGPTIAAAGFGLLARPATNAVYWTGFFPGVAVLGLGMAISVAPLTAAVMGSVDRSYAGVASGINNAAARVAALLAVAAFGVVFAGVFNHGLSERLARMNAPSAIVEAVESERGRLAGIQLPGSLPAGQRAKAQRAIDESFVDGFRWVMLISALLAATGALTSWGLIRPGPPFSRTRTPTSDC
jgi:EmrB/QacA subfamily drug resistance transporter